MSEIIVSIPPTPLVLCGLIAGIFVIALVSAAEDGERNTVFRSESESDLDITSLWRALHERLSQTPLAALGRDGCANVAKALANLTWRGAAGGVVATIACGILAIVVAVGARALRGPARTRKKRRRLRRRV